jgi:hypothetical protein
MVKQIGALVPKKLPQVGRLSVNFMPGSLAFSVWGKKLNES